MTRLFFFVILPFYCQAQNTALEALQPFLGNWSGMATAYFPRESDKPDRTEEVKVQCSAVLKGSYIECHSFWTREDGRTRELRIMLNHTGDSTVYEILFLYDNWPGKVNYKLFYDPEKRTFKGYDTFSASGGVPAEERVEWILSAGGDSIRGLEFNHFETDKPDFWPKSFEFVWVKSK